MKILSPLVGDTVAVSTQILIAEPELLLAELLGGHLERILPEASINRIRTLEALRDSKFDLAIIDVVLADGDVVEWLKSRPEAGGLSKVIVLTSCEKEVLLHSVLHSAVAGVVHKADSLEFFEIALRTVLAGGSIVSPRIHELRIGLHTDPNLYAKILSPREQAVLRGIGAGHSVQAIAKELGITDATVKDHRKNIMAKLELHNQAELLAYVMEKGFTTSIRRKRRTRAADKSRKG